MTTAWMNVAGRWERSREIKLLGKAGRDLIRKDELFL